MLKLVKCEFWKLKRKKLFWIAFLTCIIFPIFYAALLTNNDLDNIMSVVREENGFLLLIPLSIVLAANLFFGEHDYDTLKNLLCIPVTKGQLTTAKLIILLIFDIAYEAFGSVVSIIMAILSGVSLHDCGSQFLLTLGTGILLWAAALPCVLLVIWCNKSYIISVIIAFAYTVLNYILHITDAFVMVPLGLNTATFLPVPMIFRWLYQFHSMDGASETLRSFYESFSPYFVPTPIIFAVLFLEAFICTALMIKVYQKQNI